MTTSSVYDSSDSQHSGSVNLECGRNRKERRAVICQLDGNQTMDSNSNYDSEETPSTPAAGRMDSGAIPAHWGYRPSRPAPETQERREPSRRVIRRDEGLVQALTLPTISVYNMRSLWAKLNNLGDDIIMRGTDLCFLTEIWQRQENKRHKYAIEEML